MSKHTPGPWRYGQAKNYCGFYIAPELRLPTLASVKHCNTDPMDVCVFNFPSETEANARLIAAAPTMLEALKHVDKWLMAEWTDSDANSPNIHPAFAKSLKHVRAAIKLAEEGE